MSVKFLSPEWAEAVKGQLNANEAFRQAASSQRATIQQLARGPEATCAVFQGEIGQGVAHRQAVLGHAHHAQPVELVLDIGPLARRERRRVPAAELEQRL